MTLTNPKPGGYAFGEKLPSTEVNEAFAQLPYALDGNAGGSYDIGNNGIILENSSASSTLYLENAGAGAALGMVGKMTGTIEHPSGTTVTYSGGTYPKLNSRSLDRIQTLAPIYVDTTRWTYNVSLGWVQTDVTDGGFILLDVANLIQGATLTSVSMRIDGNLGGGGNHGAVPANTPTIQLLKMTATGSSNLGTASDAPANAAAYDASHELAITGLTEVIAEDAHYVFYIQGESGANSVAGDLTITRIKATFTVTDLTPGG